MCGLCIVPVRCSALTQFGAIWPRIAGNGSRLELHQNAQHELRHPKAHNQTACHAVHRSFIADGYNDLVLSYYNTNCNFTREK